MTLGSGTLIGKARVLPVQHCIKIIPLGQLELHGRCRYGVLLSPCFGALFVADLIAGMEELELHYRRRGRFNFRKNTIATMFVRMVKVLSGPISRDIAILSLRYPISRDTFSEKSAAPHNGAIPTLGI